MLLVGLLTSLANSYKPILLAFYQLGLDESLIAEEVGIGKHLSAFPYSSMVRQNVDSAQYPLLSFSFFTIFILCYPFCFFLNEKRVEEEEKENCPRGKVV